MEPTLSNPHPTPEGFNHLVAARLLLSSTGMQSLTNLEKLLAAMVHAQIAVIELAADMSLPVEEDRVRVMEVPDQNENEWSDAELEGRMRELLDYLRLRRRIFGGR